MTFDAGILLPSLLLMLSMGTLAYCLLRSFQDSMQNYSDVYAQDAARELEDLFLFIPANRIAEMARASAAVLFIVFFFLFGGLSSGEALVRGLVFGSVSLPIALFAPRWIITFLRQRRLKRFNLQLVDSLINMSSALKAGFSILQAFESVVKQGTAPISQEFGLLLQQIRVGVRFEDALRQMEDRVGSEDLILMDQSIEIARQTGGNLTEVFEKIAHTIRERMRIEERIRALTAQGRLQGIVVGSMPILLLFLMTWVEPKMMMAFFQSKIGIGMLVLVGILLILGGLVIRRIINIKV